LGSKIKRSQATSIGPLELKNMVLVFITKLRDDMYPGVFGDCSE